MTPAARRREPAPAAWLPAGQRRDGSSGPRRARRDRGVRATTCRRRRLPSRGHGGAASSARSSPPTACRCSSADRRERAVAAGARRLARPGRRRARGDHAACRLAATGRPARLARSRHRPGTPSRSATTCVMRSAADDAARAAASRLMAPASGSRTCTLWRGGGSRRGGVTRVCGGGTAPTPTRNASSLIAATARRAGWRHGLARAR